MIGVPSGASNSGVVDATTRRALECFVGKARIAVPVEAVDQIVEYEMWPPPLARRWLGGLAVYAGKILLSVALVPGGESLLAPRTSRGILLHIAGADIGWILEVGGVGSFIEAQVQLRAP